MKATLLVNLRITGKTVTAGEVFDNSEEEFPSFVMSNIDNPKVIKLTEGVVTVVTPEKVADVKAKVSKPKLNKVSKG